MIADFFLDCRFFMLDFFISRLYAAAFFDFHAMFFFRAATRICHLDIIDMTLDDLIHTLPPLFD